MNQSNTSTQGNGASQTPTGRFARFMSLLDTVKPIFETIFATALAVFALCISCSANKISDSSKAIMEQQTELMQLEADANAVKDSPYLVCSLQSDITDDPFADGQFIIRNLGGQIRDVRISATKMLLLYKVNEDLPDPFSCEAILVAPFIDELPHLQYDYLSQTFSISIGGSSGACQVVRDYVRERTDSTKTFHSDAYFYVFQMQYIDATGKKRDETLVCYDGVLQQIKMPNASIIYNYRIQGYLRASELLSHGGQEKKKYILDRINSALYSTASSFEMDGLLMFFPDGAG